MTTLISEAIETILEKYHEIFVEDEENVTV
jgi:hypothetical protein